jgi:hypothetical protein
MKETNIDCLKYRKSTHLAGVDVEMIIAQQGNCKLTIKDAYYQKNVNVSGNKTDAYIIEFVQDVKPMVVNSTNRRIIANNVKILKQLSSVESRNIGNWSGTEIELYFDEAVKMMGKITGGIRVKTIFIDHTINVKKIQLKLQTADSIVTLQEIWKSLSKNEQAHPVIAATKDKLKNTL